MTESTAAAPPPPPPNITIRRGTPADISAIVQAHYEALDQFHQFYAAFFKKHPSELIPVMTKKAFDKEPPAVFYVAEDQTTTTEEGKPDVVGFVRYSIEEAKDASKEEEENEDGKEEESPYACKEALKGVWKEFCDAQAKRDETMENAAQGRRHMCKSPASGGLTLNFVLHHMNRNSAEQRQNLKVDMLTQQQGSIIS
ncbi:hypothetical protein NLG97_g6510 [Lecanicillium saksenae]|uniref:Uncharacterized protein n=1 Tax=Lecanicillium saksenae TaxID=468837 RepID=A0ACC1QQJ5_9HYPO|nr:hypothetical protein NLG97_g6510 [Lecanicillium saksenae]